MGLFTSSAVDVRVQVDPEEVVAGEAVRVVATFGEPDKKTRGAQIELGYRNTYEEDDTDSDGHRSTTKSCDDVVVASQAVTMGEGQSPGEVVAELVVPADAPGSAHEVVEWFARATVDRKRGRDATAEEALSVLVPAEPLRSWAQTPPKVDGRCAFTLDASTRTARPGDRITGTLRVSAQEEISARGVRVQLARRRYDPDRNVTSDDSTRVELCGERTLRRGEEEVLPFEITVPSDAPPSFRAARNEQHWYLQGVVDVKRSSDPVVELEVVVHTA